MRHRCVLTSMCIESFTLRTRCHSCFILNTVSLLSMQRKTHFPIFRTTKPSHFVIHLSMLNPFIHLKLKWNKCNLHRKSLIVFRAVIVFQHQATRVQRKIEWNTSAVKYPMSFRRQLQHHMHFASRRQLSSQAPYSHGLLQWFGV